MQPGGGQFTRTRLAWIALAACAVALLFHGATTLEINGTGALYTLVSRETAETGSWAPLTYRGEPYVFKPPLLFWLTAATMRLAGAGTFAATLWPRLFGLASLALVAILARRLFGPATAFYATALLLFNGTFVTVATTFRLDAGLLFGMLLAMIALVGPEGRWRPPGFYLGIVIAVMAKGPPGFLPLILLPIHFVARNRWGEPRREPLAAWLGWSLLLALPAAWYGYLHWRLGPWATQTFLHDAFRDELPRAGERVSSAVHLYLWTPLERFLVFAPFVVWGVWRASRGAIGKRNDSHRGAEILLVLWIAIVLLAVAPKATHRERYFLPALPPLAMLGGREIARLTRDRIPAIVVAILSLAAVVGLVGLALEMPRRSDEDPATLVAMRDWVDARLSDPAEPIPVLEPPSPPPDPEAGPIVGVREWSLFHLRREVRIVEAPSLARGEHPREPFYLVYRPNEPTGLRWRTVLRARYAELIELESTSPP